METWDAIRARRNVRTYTSDPGWATRPTARYVRN
jgi:hypothetical protein